MAYTPGNQQYVQGPGGTWVPQIGDASGAQIGREGGTTLFYDDFPSTTLDTTNLWTVVSGTTAVASGFATPSATVSTYSAIRSQDLMPIGSGFTDCRMGFTLEATAATGASRFWGLGTPATTPSATVLAQDGAGFEVDASGALWAVTYANGVRTQVASLTRPTDGALHRYVVQHRVTNTYWFIDGVTTAVASVNWPSTVVQDLYAMIVRFNAASYTGTPVFTTTAVLVADTARDATMIADSLVPARRARVSSTGALSTNARLNDDLGVPITSLNDGGTENGLAVAHVATGFVFSTVNSSTAQLASGATFNGQAETVINQQAVSLLFIADQTCTVTVRQWIGISGTTGTGLISTFTYTQQAANGTTVPGLSRAFVANGNYISVHITNNGPATTTTLNLNTAYGTLPAASSYGNGPMSLNEVSGMATVGEPVGAVPMVEPPTTMFYEDFAGALDTTNKWTTVNPGAWTISGGNATYPTTAVATSVTTIPTVSVQASQYFFAAYNVRLEATAATGTGRFWGLATAATTPAINSLAQEGAGFQIDTTGVLQAVTYTGGAKTVIATLTRPFDNAIHRYGLYFRGSTTIWTIDGVEVARQNNLNIATQTVSGHLSYFATGSTIVGTPQTVLAAFGIGDRSRLHTYIADATYPWRRAQVSSAGALSVNLASSAGVTGQASQSITAAAASATTATASSTSSVLADVSNSGNATVVLTGGTYTALTLVFEAALDAAGSIWFPVDATRADGSAVEITASFTAAGTRAWNISLPGYRYLRVRASVLTSTVAPTLYIAQGPFLVDFSPSVTMNPLVPLQGPSLNPGSVAAPFYETGSALQAAAAVIAAPGAGLSIYVTDMEGSNEGATGTALVFLEGTTTTKYRRFMAASGGGFVTNLRTPWKLPANTALGRQVTVATTWQYTVNYYIAP